MAASDMITVIWTHDAPRTLTTKQNILAISYAGAMEYDKETTVINIRSIYHNTSIVDGEIVEDVPHVTLSLKTPQLAADGKFQTIHANYDVTVEPHVFIEHTTKGGPSKDNAKLKVKGVWRLIWNPTKTSEQWQRSDLEALV